MIKNFGPLLVFYITNHFYGLKIAVAMPLIWILGKIAWSLVRKAKLSLFFKYPAAISVIFGLVDLYLQQSGFSDEKSILDSESYIRQSGAQKSYADFLFKTKNEYYSSLDQVRAESPINLLNDVPNGSKEPEFYLSCGDKDEYGFFYGAEEFVKLAEKKGLSVIWKPEIGGKHCTADVDSLIPFLEK